MFSLKGTIDPAANADEDDVINTKNALSRLGFFHGPIDPFPTSAMIEGIQRFQAASGLAQDGVMKPQGPTEAALDLFLRHAGSRNAKFSTRIDRDGLLNSFNRLHSYDPRDGKCRATGTCEIAP